MRRRCAKHELQDADENCVFMYTKTATTLVGVRVILTTYNMHTNSRVVLNDNQQAKKRKYSESVVHKYARGFK
jgi:hypothetical protein